MPLPPPATRITRTRQHHAIAIVVAILTVGSTACSSGSGSPEAVRTATIGKGSPIAAGFTVVDGSALLAPAFPAGVNGYHDGEPIIDDGFVAFLEVRGDPRRVISAYLDQAAALGMTIDPASLLQPPRQRINCATYLDAFFCEAHARNPDEARPWSVALHFARGHEHRSPSWSHLELRYSTTYANWQYGCCANLADDTEPPPVPDNITVDADEDTLFEGWSLATEMAVVDGSSPVIELPNSRCSSKTTPQALLRVTADPDAIMDEYAQRFDAVTGEGIDAETPLDVPGGRLLALWASESGGRSYRAQLYDRADGDDWLLIDTCYD